jgi:hypothetical protein
MILLKQILNETNLTKVYGELRQPETLKMIFDQFADSPAEWLGGGYYGQAIATQRGKVIKFTADQNEAALAARISKRARRPHLINIYSVRPLAAFRLPSEDSNDIQTIYNHIYAIYMDRVTPLTSEMQDAWLGIKYMYFSSSRPDSDLRRSIDYDLSKNSITQDMYNQLNTIIDQRQKVLQDVRAMNINFSEAHGGNVGFTKHGNFVLFDLQALSNPIMKGNIPVPSKSTIGKPIDVKFTTDGIDTPGDPNM